MFGTELRAGDREDAVLVSVMMPAYNAEGFIETAIESVCAQTLVDWELIVVDDGSTDGTASIVTGFKDHRIRLIRQQNGGEAAARNTAIENLNGKYLAFLDADDLYLPNHLEHTVRHLERNPDYDAVYTDGYYIDQSGNRQEKLSSHRRGPFQGRIFEELVRASDVFGPPICVLLKSSLVKDTRFRFDKRIVIGPDWDFFTRLSDVARFAYLDKTTCLYRVHDTNITVQVDQQRRAGYLSICREKAIQIPSFAECSAETRAAVFFDLLLNLQRGRYERQKEITLESRFADLPSEKQAWLFRLMASDAILDSGPKSYIKECLSKARELDSSDRRSRILSFLYQMHPSIPRYFLRIKQTLRAKQGGSTPFGNKV